GEVLHLGRSEVLQHLRDKKVRLAGHLCQNPGRRVRLGQRLEIVLANPKVSEKSRPRGPGKRTNPAAAAPIRSPLAQGIRVRYLDSHIVVVYKPPGLTTVRHASE